MNPTTAVLVASIPAALTAGAAILVGWLQNRKTRDAVNAVGVNEKLQLIVDTQALHGRQMDFLSEKVDDHLSDHKYGRVVPIRKRAS